MGLCESKEYKQARQAREAEDLKFKIREQARKKQEQEQEREEREYHLSICKRCYEIEKYRTLNSLPFVKGNGYYMYDIKFDCVEEEYKKYTSMVDRNTIDNIKNLLLWDNLNKPLQQFWVGDFLRLYFHGGREFRDIICIIDNIGFDYEKGGEIKYFIVRPLGCYSAPYPHNVFYEEIDLTDVKYISYHDDYIINGCNRSYLKDVSLHLRIPVKTDWNLEAMMATIVLGNHEDNVRSDKYFYLGAMPFCCSSPLASSSRCKNEHLIRQMQDIMEDQ